MLLRASKQYLYITAIKIKQSRPAPVDVDVHIHVDVDVETIGVKANINVNVDIHTSIHVKPTFDSSCNERVKGWRMPQTIPLQGINYY